MLITKTPKTIRDNYMKTKPCFQSFNLRIAKPGKES